MKTIVNYFSKNSLILAIVLLITSTSQAATYSTLTNGNWNDVTNVWSLDGITPCGCTPATPSGVNDIILNHNITMSYNLVFNGGNFIISPGASLTGPFNINIWNANMDVFGNLSIAKYNQNFSTNVTLHPGAIMSLTNRFVLEDGNFTMDGALIYMASGNFDIFDVGSFYVTNASRVNIANGNITNNGYILLETGSCMTSNGNWKNEVTGTVSGGGSATTNVGNIQNSGIWDVALLWCSAGSDFGMPSPEDCAGALGVCNGIQLPVELAGFSAQFMDGFVLISWETVSETNNDYFIVLRSSNGVDWKEVDRIDGAGTTTNTQHYETEDVDFTNGVNYYQLVQVDFDGRENYSEVISVRTKLMEADPVVYPNPAVTGSNVRIENLDNSYGKVSLLDLSGHSVSEVEIQAYSNRAEITIPQVSPGIYLLVIEQNGETKQLKLMVN